MLRRRAFIRKSLAATAGIAGVRSLEEYALVAQAAEPAPLPASSAPPLPMGQVGKVKISRLICGGNLISGYAHSRDLIYVSNLLKRYFDDEKIMETWARCEQHGINTMICYPDDRHAIDVYQRYVSKEGGRMQYIAQVNPKEDDLQTVVSQAVDNGAAGVFLVGNLGDQWTRDGKVGLIGEFIAKAKAAGLIAGVAGHELRTTMAVARAGIQPDFYMKTLHSTDYWSRRQPGQNQEVIDNYGIDNYWCMEPQDTIAFLRQLKVPWFAYKVLAAGAIHPRDGFRYAFENGADFAVVGMFDFQVQEDADVARTILTGPLNRPRPWMA